MKFFKAFASAILQLLFPGAGFICLGKTRIGYLTGLGFILAYLILNWISLYMFWLALALLICLLILNLGFANNVFKKMFYAHATFAQIRYVTAFVIISIVTSTIAVSFKRDSVFYIPTESMIPTLLAGDRVYVDVRAFTSHDPLPGDTVVFRYPKNQNVVFIKRVIAVPGDKVVWDHENVAVNGVSLKITSAHDANENESLMAPYEEREGLKIAIESVGSQNHMIAWNAGVAEEKGEMQVSEGQFFVLGDFRTRGSDSRNFGPVDRRLFIGKPTMVLWSNTREYRPRFERVGQKID